MELINIRQVVPAVRQIRVKTGNPVRQRRAPKLSYAKARQRWWIQVQFNSDLDLMIFEKAVAGSEIRLVELNDCFYLEDPRITDTAEMGEAFRLAESLLAQVNGAVQVSCRHFQSARFESMIELSENGTLADRFEVSVEVMVRRLHDFGGLNGDWAPVLTRRNGNDFEIEYAVYPPWLKSHLGEPARGADFLSWMRPTHHSGEVLGRTLPEVQLEAEPFNSSGSKTIFELRFRSS